MTITIKCCSRRNENEHVHGALTMTALKKKLIAEQARLERRHKRIDYYKYEEIAENMGGIKTVKKILGWIEPSFSKKSASSQKRA
jgi:hypothetical protein